MTPNQNVKSLAFRRWQCSWFPSLVAGLVVWQARANPDGLTVSRGQVTSFAAGAQLSLRVTDNAVLDWQHFNIKPGEVTTFLQTSRNSVVWNQIHDLNPSQILGGLNANGAVVLYNQNGFYFGKESIVNVGGLIVSAAPMKMPDPGVGGLWQFNGAPPSASIINYGQMTAARGGGLFLIAEKIENHGVLTAPDGTIGLYAGKEVLMSERPDGRGISASVTLPQGSVDNFGKLIADSGVIALHAQVVNQNGLVQANSVRERNGVIELVASEAISLGASSRLQADGDPAALSSGGRITLKSDGRLDDAIGSLISVRGSIVGGNGGDIELSAHSMTSVKSALDASAAAGSLAGNLVLDPANIILSNSGDDSASNGSVSHHDPPDTLRLNINTAFQNFARITLQAEQNISVGDISSGESLDWNLNDSTGISIPGSLLTLQAGRDIIFGGNSRIVAGTGWSVRLSAGADFSAAFKAIPGVGGIYLNGGPADVNGNKLSGSGSIEIADGSLELLAGNEIALGGGYVRSVGGGNLKLTTLAGDIDAGIKPDWLQFSRNGYQPSTAGVGGIATVNGGNVELVAGRDILSFLPVVGAYGAGDVSLAAGQHIFGIFLVQDGAGTMNAGTDIGSATSPVSLNLVKGSWDLHAARDLFLNEVRNPNAAFNANKPAPRFNGQTISPDQRIPFLYDYAPDASVILSAGNSVQLLGSNLPRQNGNRDMPPIYPPILDITAGAGGVILGNDVTLYPSSLGNLTVHTTAGGGFQSTVDNFFQLVMSDSGSFAWQDFTTGHAAVPRQLAGLSPGPIQIMIAGSARNIFLRLPRHAEIEIGGDTLNFGFEGQNLSSRDTTEIKVGGDIRSRGNITAEPVSTAPNLAAVDPALSENTDIGAKLSYNAVTRQLEFQGRMSAAERDFLLAPAVRALDISGNPAFDDTGNPLFIPATFVADPNIIQHLYQNSQEIPSSGLAYAGLQVAGPGAFRIAANQLDLGITKGIRAGDLTLNNALAAISSHGASIDIKLAGDLQMTSSQIASFGGGPIHVVSNGALNVGSERQFSSDDTPKGIYTAHGGEVSVVARGNISVNGSRIATYDGGNVTVTSTEGNIDAGEGARGIFTVSTQQINPITGLVETRNDNFFGSGILALTRTDSTTPLGSITITADKGSISANSGGILQLAFNNVENHDAAVNLQAGQDIEANLSGVLGVNVNLRAGGNVRGLLVANQNINISAEKTVNVTALATGGVKIDAGGSVSGTIMAGGNLSVSGDAISAALISSTGSTSTKGDSSAAQVGAFNNVAAPTVTKNVETASETATAAKQNVFEEDETKKRQAALPVLSKLTGRVTVILPKTK